MKICSRLLWVSLFLALLPVTAQAVIGVNGDTYSIPADGILLVEPDGVIANDTMDDAESSPQFVLDIALNHTITVTTPPSEGTLKCGTAVNTVCADGSFEFTVSPTTFSGIDSFTYKLEVDVGLGTYEFSEATVVLSACSTTGTETICWTEGSFFDALAATEDPQNPYHVKHEGFEGAAWTSYRSYQDSNLDWVYNGATTISSKGIDWSSNHTATNIVSTSTGGAYSGSYGVFDPDHGFATNTSIGECQALETANNGVVPPECLPYDGVSGTSATTLYAVGGYIKGSNSAANIDIITDGGLPNNIGKLVTPAHQFYGIINTAGFTSFQFRDIDGKTGQPLYIFGDDFYLATRDAADENQAPVIGAVADQSVAAGGVFDITIPVSDPDDDAVKSTFSGIPVSGNNPRFFENDGNVRIRWFVPTTATGTYPVSVTVTDNGYPNLTQVLNFQLTVTPPPPTLNLPNNITAEATSASGATVNYTVSATDSNGVSLSASCTPASGSTFALTTTTVNCSVTDSNSQTTTGSFTITVVEPNIQPTADAGNAQNVFVSNIVTLDGSLSSDANGDTLTYQWTLTTPAGSTAVLVNATSVSPTFIADVAGQYTAQLVVNDGTIDSAVSSVLITVNNNAPVANAGTAQTVAVSDVVTLDGSQSSDANGDALTYQWTLTTPLGSTAALSNTASVNPTFIPDVAGSYTAHLVVNDGTVDSAAASVTVTANNTAPVANAGTAQTVAVSNLVTLDGSLSSDANGDALTYQWTLSTPVGSTSTLSNATAVSPTFTVDIAGSYTAQLVVNDGTVDSAAASVTVTANNTAPVANAGTAQTVAVSNLVTLDGSLSSDANGDALTYQWTLSTPVGSTATLSNATAVSPTFTVDIAGSYTAQLVVNDGTVDSAAASVTVTANNTAPVANAGTAQTVAVSNLVTLDGSLSSDANGDTLTYQWSLTKPNTSAAALSSATSVSPTFTPDIAGSYTAYLVVNDGTVDSASSSVTITANNTAPLAVNDVVGTNEDTSVIIDVLANDTDANGDALSVNSIGIISSGTATIGTNNTITYTPALNASGDVTFSYTISDGTLTATATVTVTVNAINDVPVAADDVASTDEDSPVTISVLTNDSDIDGDSLSILSKTDGTHGSVVISPGNTQVSYTPAANFHGTDSFTYTVTDGNGGSASATVVVTVNPINDAPVAADDVSSTNEDTPVTITVLTNDSDVDSATLNVIAIGAPTSGTAATGANNTIVYTPAANTTGNATFTYTISDGALTATATVTVTVNAINDAPVAADDAASTDEDTPVTITVLTNDSDVDSTTLNVTAVGTPSSGTAVKGANNTIEYTPATNFTGNAIFSYTISDGLLTATASVTVSVNPVNDAPIALNDFASTNEDTPVTISVLNNDSDVDSATLSVTAIGTPTSGTAVAGLNNTIEYTPAVNTSGDVSFSYTISDGTLTATAIVTVTVNAINDVPVAADDVASTDEDSSVTISVLTNDSDIDGDSLTILSKTDGTHGSVVISPGNTQVSYTPAANFHGTDSFTYTVTDGNGGSATATVVVTVNPINDAPVATDDVSSTTEDTAVTISVLLNDTDVDNDALSVSGVGVASNGSLVVNAGTTITYTPGLNFNGTDSFTYTISDGNGGTASGTVNVSVGLVNDAPIAVADTATTNEDSAVTINVVSNDTDADNDALEVLSTTTAGNGSLVISGNKKSIIYTPDTNFNGTDTFNYTVTDNRGGTSSALVTVTVQAQNDSPVARDDVAATDEDVAVTINVLANDNDVDSATLDVTSVSLPTSGTAVTGANNTIVYTPAANTTGNATFTYTISDGALTATATVTVTVNAINDAPVAADDAASTDEDTPVTITVLTNDSDVDSTTLNVTAVGTPSSGTAVKGANNTIEYTPATNFTGNAIFSYTISDGLLTATASVTVSVNPVNDAPIALNDFASTNEDTPVTISVLNNDSDVDSATLSVTAIGTPTSGTAVAGLNNTIEYTPAVNTSGDVSFSYTISDGTLTVTATVTVTVNSINDVPVAADDVASTDEDTPVTISVLTNDSDIDGDSLSILSKTDGTHGSVVIGPGNTQVSYTPAANFNGSDNFTYTVTDGNGGSASATVVVTVNPINDAPVATDDVSSTTEDTAVTISVLLNDTDVDNDALSVSGVGVASNGSLVVNAGTTITYTPGLNFNGTDSFTYTISDGNGGTASGTVNVSVGLVNDAPIAVADTATTNEDSAVTINVVSNDTDADNDALEVLSTTTAGNGSLAISVDKKSITYTPNTNFNGADSFNYTVTDNRGGASSALVTVTVQAQNDNPIAGNDVAATDEDVAVTINVLANDSDIDGDTLTIVPITQVLNGTVIINTDNTVTYTPNADFNGNGSFSYNISDGKGGSATATVSVTVNSVNDAPVAVDDTSTTDEDTTVIIPVLANDSDVDGDTLQVSGTGLATNGSVVLNADNSISYTPASNFSGDDSFTYSISDNKGGVSTATVTITVNPINNAPIANAGTDRIVDVGDLVTLDGSLSSYNNGDILSYQWTLTVPAGSSAVLTQANTVNPQFTADVAGSYTAQLIVNDGSVDSVADTVVITARPPADVAPAFTAESIVTIPSTGYLTPMPSGLVSVNDLEDGVLQPTANNPGPFAPGLHEIIWSVTDSGNNTVTFPQALRVLPMLNFPIDRQAEVGADIAITLSMNGVAPEYPVDVIYDVAINGASSSHTLSITSGKVVTFNYRIPATANAGDTISFSLQSVTNAVAGIKNNYSISVIDTNIAPIVEIEVTQNGVVTKNIHANSGLVTVLANIYDANLGDSHTLDWSTTDNNISVLASDKSFSFDPFGLMDGNYKIGVKVVDSGLLEAENEIYVQITAEDFNPLDGLDSDYDGIEDALEGDHDDDNDGVPNYLDAIDNQPEILQMQTDEAGKRVLATQTGLSLRLGKTAQLSGGYGANVTPAELAQFAGLGRTAVPADTNDDKFTPQDGYLDFTINGLTQPGQSARIVIPLLDPIPEQAVYRKYNVQTGWSDFVEDVANELSSAPGVDGVCPAPGSSDYDLNPGLKPAYYCIQMLIQDGGPNDNDYLTNGVITDPGGVAVAKAPTTPTTPSTTPATSGSSGGGGGATDFQWILSMMLLLTLTTGIRVWKTRQ